MHRSPNILLIPRTSSLKHLRENLATASLVLPSDAMVVLDEIGAGIATTKGIAQTSPT